MRLKVVVHEADEGGFWAEVPAIAGCATEGDTFEELLTNLYEPSRVACPSMWLTSRPGHTTGSWTLPYEVSLRARSDKGARAERPATPPH